MENVAVKNYTNPGVQEYTPTPAQERESDVDPAQRVLNIKPLPEVEKKPELGFKLKEEMPKPDLAVDREREAQLKK